ncbi:MAG TPA: hypothetical protein VIX89_03640 [Bryobacteraceae bacterium]
MSDLINDSAMQPGESEELFVVELDGRFEFGMTVIINDIPPLDGSNCVCGCSSEPTNPGCLNATQCT